MVSLFIKFLSSPFENMCSHMLFLVKSQSAVLDSVDKQDFHICTYYPIDYAVVEVECGFTSECLQIRAIFLVKPQSAVLHSVI